jgi:prepilin-type N-terminal cleavage/methylation domain-containing protein
LKGRRHLALRAAGFTLLELLIALSIVGALLAIAFGGLRMAISAWTRGDDRAEAQQHTRGITQIVGRTVGAACPYRGALGEGPEKRILFRGAEKRLELVTQAAPFPSVVPVAFTAVVIVRVGDVPVRVGLERIGLVAVCVAPGVPGTVPYVAGCVAPTVSGGTMRSVRISTWR